MMQNLLLVKVANIKWSNLDADGNECDVWYFPTELVFTLRSVSRGGTSQVEKNFREEIKDHLLNKYYFVPLSFDIVHWDNISEE